MFDSIILRRISTVVLFAFTSLTLQPLQAVAQSRLTQANSARSGTPDVDEQYARLLNDIQEGAKRGAGKAAKGQSTRNDTKALRQQAAQLQALQSQIDQSFSSTEAQLGTANVSAEILARHSAAVAQYQSRQSEFKRLLKTLEDADDQEDETHRANGLAGMSTWLEQNNKRKTHTPLDPAKLPSGGSKPNPRAPATTKTAWFQNLYADQKVQLAQAGGGQGASIGGVQFNIPPQPTQAPSATDLAETEDIQISDVVRAQAATLGNNPVNIANWVKNSIEWVPSWGSIQGAELTLVNRRGNAVDIASLTIAMLRASGIPARYVLGTAEIPATKLANWVGGAPDVDVALSLLQQGGIATSALTEGGRIKTVVMEHAWVQAFVNWTPSRGNRQGGNMVKPPVLYQGLPQHVNPNGQLNAWVEIDTSFKQYTFSNPVNIGAVVPFDINATRTAAASGATIDTAQGYISGLNETTIQATLRAYSQRVQAYLDGHPDLALPDLVKTKEVVSDGSTLLAGTSPLISHGYQILTSLPDSLRHSVTFRLYANALDRSMDSPVLTYRASLPSLRARRLGVTYEPASVADAQLISNAVTAGANTLPAYLINVRPALQIDGATVSSGPTVRMGSDQFWTISFTDPAGLNNANVNYDNAAGDEMVFGVNGNGVTPDLIAKRMVEGKPNTAAGNLEQAALYYWLQHDNFDQMIAAPLGAMTMRMPSVIKTAAPLTVSYFFGIARSASYQSQSGDAKRVLTAVAAKDEGVRRQFMLMAGLQGSAIEGSVFDELFNRPEETSVSTTQYLAIAARQGLRIYSITADNINTALPLLAVSADVKDDIANAIATGLVAFVPEREITQKGFTGVGYLLFNPNTGEGAYLIDGGRNGLNQPSCSKSATPQATEISAQSLLNWQTLVPALVGFVDTGAATEAERQAKKIVQEAIAQAAKPAAQRIAAHMGPRLLASVAVPGANVAMATATAVAVSMEILMFVYAVKMIFAELEIQTVARTDEDEACICREDPNNPKCSCKKIPVPHKPPRVVPQITTYDRRVDWHHNCADSSGNSYGGMDVDLYTKEGFKANVDLFSNPLNLACEVKTSFRDTPYDPVVLKSWMDRLKDQLATQKKATRDCGWQHCVIVNKPWMKEKIDGLNLGYDVRLNETCGSAVQPPDPLEVPVYGLD